MDSVPAYEITSVCYDITAVDFDPDLSLVSQSSSELTVENILKIWNYYETFKIKLDFCLNVNPYYLCEMYDGILSIPIRKSVFTPYSQLRKNETVKSNTSLNVFQIISLSSCALAKSQISYTIDEQNFLICLDLHDIKTYFTHGVPLQIPIVIEYVTQVYLFQEFSEFQNICKLCEFLKTSEKSGTQNAFQKNTIKIVSRSFTYIIKKYLKYTQIVVPIFDATEDSITIHITPPLGWKIPFEFGALVLQTTSSTPSLTIPRKNDIGDGISMNKAKNCETVPVSRYAFDPAKCGGDTLYYRNYNANKSSRYTFTINKKAYDETCTPIKYIYFWRKAGSRNKLMGLFACGLLWVSIIFLLVFVISLSFGLAGVLEIDFLSHLVAVIALITAILAYFFTYNTLRLNTFKFNLEESKIQKYLKISFSIAISCGVLLLIAFIFYLCMGVVLNEW